MQSTLHITSGDLSGANLTRRGLAGEVLVWHDVLYDGPRQPGWPDAAILRARFLEELTAGGLNHASILQTLETPYAGLAAATSDVHLVLRRINRHDDPAADFPNKT